MKKTLKLSMIPLATLTFVNSTVALGRPATTIAPAVIAQNPGQYNHRQYDQSRLESEVLSILRSNNADDVKYVESTVAQLNQALTNLRSEHLVPRAGQINIASLLTSYAVGSGSALDAKSETAIRPALGAIQKFKVDLENAKNLVGSITLIPSVVKRPDDVRIDGGKVTVPGLRSSLDFTNIINHYNAQIAVLEAGLASAQIMVLENTGAPTVQSVLAIKLGNAYTQAQLDKMQADEMRLMLLPKQSEIQMKQVHLFTKDQFIKIIQIFGEDQRYRLNLNEEGKKDAVESFRRLMWMRSLLRASTGVPAMLGTFGIDYKKRQLNWDLLADNTNINWIVADPIRSKTDLEQVRDNLINKLWQLESRTQNVLSSETYKKAVLSPAGAVSAINSLSTFLRGNYQLAEVSKIVLKEIALDVQEEYLLGEGKFEEMRRLYQARWYTGKSEAEIKAVREEANRLMSMTSAPSTGATALNQAANTQTLIGTFYLAKAVVSNYISAYNQALQIRAVREAAQSNEAARQDVQKNLNDL